jgi:DNA-directed RNA polymerase I subunit RPA1
MNRQSGMTYGLRTSSIYTELNDISFGFYTSEEIKSISVAKLSNSTAFDILDNPVPGGLYDERLGPVLYGSK